MIKRSFLFISIIMTLSLTCCIKETYNMNMLSKQAILSPTLAISAVKGDISLSDIVKANDTVVYDQNNFVTLVFKKDSVVELKMSDFSKGTLVKKTAIIDPTSYDLNIHKILNHITGNFQFLNPSIKFNYSNSFPDSIKINLIASGTGENKTINLNLAPFPLAVPNIPIQQEITASYIIDKTNSNLPDIISIPPEVVNFSGTAIMTSSVKSSQTGDNILGPNHLTGSLEIDIPMDLEINNLQFTDTVDNFLQEKSNGKNNPVKPEDFQSLRINISAKNGFPLGAALKMNLYDSSTNSIKSTVEATDILDPAPVDSNGKVTGVTETSTTVEFTREFFSYVNNADKIIFRFTFSTTGNGSQEVKIYSDYRISFNASLVVKPVINLN
ncbi:MAG: hypothetical protein ABR927_00795 [Bacteroidales bacterium]